MNITLKLFSLLVFVSSTANLVKCGVLDEVSFPANLLQPDLKAFEDYFKEIGSNTDPDAFINWPHSITFLVKRVNENSYQYLEIRGVFKTKKALFFSGSYNNLYYREGEFFEYDPDAYKMKPFSGETVVHYEQPRFYRGEKYLAITYKSMEEIGSDINNFYVSNKQFVDTYSENAPATYLASRRSERPIKYFVEYTTWSDSINMDVAEGGLLALIGKVKKNKVILSSNHESERLVFYQKEQKVLLPMKHDAIYPYVEDVFGVRMSKIGFLAEVIRDKVKLLGSAHLDRCALTSPTRHLLNVEDFLRKLEKVEPRKCYFPNDKNCISLRPNVGKFQVCGHILTKKINYLHGKIIDEECPFLIQYDNNSNAVFMLANIMTEELCTDDLELWLKNAKDNYSSPVEFLTLYYDRFDRSARK